MLFRALLANASPVLLQLGSLSSFAPPTSLLALPSASSLTVSVALCSDSARFYLSTTGADPNLVEISLDGGLGQWSGSAPDGGLLSIQDFHQGSFQIAVSDNGTAFEMLDQLPLLADTTSDQAILFSQPFLPPPPTVQPTFPNYTLPPPVLSPPDVPSSIPNLTLVAAPTSLLSPLAQAACLLSNVSSTSGSIVDASPWLRESDGWRIRWLLDGLLPSTNYTAYVVQDALKLSGPVYFTTKSSKFPCPLVHSLPFCPSTAYAVPLPPVPTSAFGYNASSLPDNITSPLLQYMSNFTAMLSTFGCGRDLYSPLQTCADCQVYYRAWLCSVSFPRCSEASPATSTVAQLPLSALQPQPSGSPSRNLFFPNASYDYSVLLPCLETCNAVDRACPYFLGIKCPMPKFNAGASYGVGFVDSGNPGEMGMGLTGVGQDRWGNMWCNPS